MPKDEPIIKNKPKLNRPKRDLGLTWFVVVILIFLVGVPAYIFFPKEKTFKLANYTYASVQVATFRNLVRGTGSVTPKDTVQLTAKYHGVLKNVNIEPLMDVKKGDVLLEIDSPELTNSLKEQKDLLIKAEAELQKAVIDAEIELQKVEWSVRDGKKAIEDAKKLYEEKELMYSLGTISKRELEDAKASLTTKEEDLVLLLKNQEKVQITTTLGINAAKRETEAINKKISEMEQSITENTFIAPIDGKALEVLVKPGIEVNAGTTLVKLVSISEPYAQIKINADEADLIEEKMPATLKIAGRSYAGIVNKITIAFTTDNTPYVLADVNFVKDPGFILPGTEAQVEIETSRRENVICLPRGPFISSGQSMFVYRIDGAKAFQTDVSYGAYDGNLIEIKNGLNPGDKIITSSYEAYKDRKEIILDLEGGRFEE